MRLTYLIAAHNEAAELPATCRRVMALSGEFPDLRVVLLENGSTDRTLEVSHALAAEFAGAVTVVECAGAGIGLAFRAGLMEMADERLTADDWIVLAAADLPFAFTDLRAVRAALEPDVAVYVGSKAHPRSRVSRGLKRRAGSWAFYLLRRMTLGLGTRDPQGSIFIRGDAVERLRDFAADNYFFSVELIDRAERTGRVVEVPIELQPERRPSRVNVLRDGFKLLRQLLIYRARRARAASIGPTPDNPRGTAPAKC